MSDERFPEKWVRVMCDVTASPLWNAEGYPREVDDLPVSVELRAELAKWYEQYNDDIGWRDRAKRSRVSSDVIAFSRWGLALARRVKTELPDWTVIYFDEAEHERTNDRKRFQYEIF